MCVTLVNDPLADASCAPPWCCLNKSVSAQVCGAWDARNHGLQSATRRQQQRPHMTARISHYGIQSHQYSPAQISTSTCKPPPPTRCCFQSAPPNCPNQVFPFFFGGGGGSGAVCVGLDELCGVQRRLAGLCVSWLRRVVIAVPSSMPE